MARRTLALLMSDELVLVRMEDDAIQDFTALPLADTELAALPGAALRVQASTYHLLSEGARDRLVAAYTELQATPHVPVDEKTSEAPPSAAEAALKESEPREADKGEANVTHTTHVRPQSLSKGDGKSKGSHKAAKGSRKSVKVGRDESELVIPLSDDDERVMFTVHLGTELKKSVLVTYVLNVTARGPHVREQAIDDAARSPRTLVPSARHPAECVPRALHEW